MSALLWTWGGTCALWLAALYATQHYRRAKQGYQAAGWNLVDVPRDQWEAPDWLLFVRLLTGLLSVGLGLLLFVVWGMR